jgi:hypothetical protein
MTANAHDVGAPLDLRVEPLERVGRVDLRPVRPREGHEGEHVALGLVHQHPEPGELAAQLIGHRSPLRPGRIGRLLNEHRADNCRDRAPLRLGSVRRASRLSLMTSLTPRSPRPFRLLRNSVQNGSASECPTLSPSTSRRSSVLTPTHHFLGHQPLRSREYREMRSPGLAHGGDHLE